ncbi:hypothetical protein C2G38_2244848 [Gigaspora rosea]|uniref:Uncharacterized protein n=1 Tax=Gigaspora rosea TaxID=44941 RepID=A0A397VLD3_9GLOM|nr:hypothetical protein C2G38_2244848 [Gigaspora rosea]
MYDDGMMESNGNNKNFSDNEEEDEYSFSRASFINTNISFSDDEDDDDDDDEDAGYLLLQFKNRDDFTYDKVKEHMLYKSALNLLSKDHDQSRKCLLNFEVKADGVLRMLEGTTAGQQHVFNIQQQDLLGLYQSGDNDLTNTSMMTLSNILNHPGKHKFEGDHQPKTPPMRPSKVIVTTPEKPTLYKHNMQHLAKHFSVYVNNQCVIMKSEKDVFESNIMAPLNSTPADPFQQAIQSVYREYSFDWIEVQASCIKDIKVLFPEFDFTLNKVNGIGSKVSSNKEIIFIEVSGGPENAVLKHVKEDTEKLIKEAMFGLISLLRGYLDKGAKKARNICVYMVQYIGDRITLSEVCLDKKHFYKISQIKSAMLPFSFDEVEKSMEVF